MPTIISKIFPFFDRKPVDPFVNPKEQATEQIKKTLREFSFIERDEIMQSAIRDILPKKHLKYRAGQERY